MKYLKTVRDEQKDMQADLRATLINYQTLLADRNTIITSLRAESQELKSMIKKLEFLLDAPLVKIIKDLELKRNIQTGGMF